MKSQIWGSCGPMISRYLRNVTRFFQSVWLVQNGQTHFVDFPEPLKSLSDIPRHPLIIIWFFLILLLFFNDFWWFSGHSLEIWLENLSEKCWFLLKIHIFQRPQLGCMSSDHGKPGYVENLLEPIRPKMSIFSGFRHSGWVQSDHQVGRI